MRSDLVRILVLVLVLSTALTLPALAGDGFDYYVNYLESWDWPDQHTPTYAEDVQGIAHDDDYWFITKQGAHGTVLYKIHVSQSLASPTVTASTTPSASGLTGLGFDKFKGMDSYKSPIDGQWYLVIGVEGGSTGGIAVYTTNLALKGAAVISQPSASWAAVDNAGYVYSAVNNSSTVNRYQLNWSTLATSGAVSVTAAGNRNLQDSSGNSIFLTEHQGADFTPEGDKLYVVTGFIGVSSGPHGIHVFDATNPSYFTRLMKSDQSGMFRYQFDPDCGTICEEPEGLTFWDLNDGRAPNIRGELHVLMLDNDWPDDDDVYLKHYTEGIWVDASHSGSSNGDPFYPDLTVTSAVNRAIEGMELKVYSGIYSEGLTITKRVKIVNPSSSGSAVIGQ